MTKKFFDGYDVRTKRFYSRVVNSAMINILAHQRGLFPTLFCQTEDPLVMLKWQEALPRIIEQLDIPSSRRTY